MNTINRWALQIEKGSVKEIPISEEEFVKTTFEQYDIEVVTPKDKLINAQKKGDYVIGVNYNPFVLENVFHYENETLDCFKFKDVGEHIMIPLKLRRATCVSLKNKDSSFWETIANAISNYDEFIVCRKGTLLDV